MDTKSEDNEELTPEQLTAIKAYAAANGARWKTKLHSDWLYGTDTPLLRQIRNRLGPEWLMHFKLEK